MPTLGPLELGIILLIVLVVFGPKRLPGLGRQLGSGMREFKESITGKDDDREEDRDPSGLAPAGRVPAPRRPCGGGGRGAARGSGRGPSPGRRRPPGRPARRTSPPRGRT